MPCPTLRGGNLRRGSGVLTVVQDEREFAEFVAARMPAVRRRSCGLADDVSPDWRWIRAASSTRAAGQS
jgi:hypothetical protein